MRKRLRFRFWVGWLCWVPVAWAAVPPEGWEDILSRFEDYGLPDVSSAAYVNVMACWRPRVNDLLPDDWETSGNAWMFSEVRDAEGQPIRATVVVDGSRKFDVEDSRYRKKVKGKQALTLDAPAVPEEIPARGRWEAGNPVRDAEKGVQFLESLKWEGEPYGHYRYPGKLFLLAYGLRQRGDAASAAALLSELAAREGGAEGVAQEAMNLVADGEYENLYQAFRVDHDWTAYRDGIQQLLEKYPDGWHAAPILQFLLTRVEARIANPNPVPPASEAWSPDDLQQAAGMMGIRRVRGGADIYADVPALWIAPSDWRDSVPEPLDAEMKIRIRGMEAVPFLLALMEEGDVLTEADRLDVSKDGPYRSRFQPEELADAGTEERRQTKIQEGYAGMNRPATRAEIAGRLLRDMIPEWVVGGSYGRMSKEEFMEAVREFDEAHHAATEEEWAVLSLPGRYSSFNLLAKKYLLKVAREKAIPELEAFLLDENWLVPDSREDKLDYARDSKANLLKAYAVIRGEEARPLVNAFAAQARQQAEAFAAMQAEEKGGRKNERAQKRESRLCDTAASLEAMVLEKAPETDAEEVVQRPLYTNGCIDRAVLNARYETLPLAEALDVFLEMALDTTNAFNRGTLALIIGKRLDSEHDHCAIATAHAEAWNELIADDRVGFVNKGAPLVSDKYLILNERLFSPSAGETEPDDRYSWEMVDVAEQAVQRVLRAYGKRGRDWLRDRVRQRLSGVPEEELPAFPDGSAPDEEVIESLRARFSSVADREAAAELAAKLTLPERLALSEMLRQEPELNSRLAELANRVERVSMDEDADDRCRQLRAWEGKAFAPELMEELRHCAEERAKEGKPFTAKLLRHGEFGGCEVVVETAVPVPEYYSRQNASQRISGYAGLVCGLDLYGAARWRTAPPPEKETWWAVETSGPFELRGFQEATERFFDGSQPAGEEAFVVFQTQGEKQ